MNFTGFAGSLNNDKREEKRGRELLALFGIALLIVLAAFTPLLLRNHYSTDSYHLLKDQHTTWYLQCGRYTFWLFACLFDKLGVNLVLAQRWFIAACLACLAGCSAALTRFFERLCGLCGTVNGFFLVVPVSLIWCNVFMEDWILFPEVAGMIAMAAIGLTASVIVFFRDESAVSLCLSALLLLLTLGSYQSMVGSYIAATVIVSCLKYRGDLRSLLVSAAKGILVGGICAVLNIAILKLIIACGVFGESGRGSTFDIQAILSNVTTVIQYQLAFWKDADGLLPCPVMQLLELSLVVLFIQAFRRNAKAGFALLCAFVISVGAAFAPHYVEAAILLSPRSNIAVWTAIGCVLAVLWCDPWVAGDDTRGGDSVSADAFGRGDVATRIAALALVAFSIVSFVLLWDISYDAYTSNVQDREYATSIAVAIARYENETGVPVYAIGIVDDASPENSYKEVRYRNHELGRRIMNVSYARIEMINWLSGRDLQQIDVSNEKARELFGTTDWGDENLGEQLKFEDGIAYLAVY